MRRCERRAGTYARTAKVRIVLVNRLSVREIPVVADESCWRDRRLSIPTPIVYGPLSTNESGSLPTGIVRSAGSFTISIVMPDSVGETESLFPVIDVLEETWYRC